ncbi:MAG: hypothetical protein L3J91_00195, partial [Thermoplasmata archaeon]|nr:hypothetical protein [Thermoplasmata archaeon]
MTADASEPTWFDRRPPRRRRNWSSPRHDRVHLGAAIVAVSAVFALVLTLLVLYPSSGPSPPTIVSVRAVVNTTAGPRNLGSEFWGVNVGPNVEPSTALADALARSPARVVRFPGGASGDEFNFTAGTLTNDSGVAKPAVENLSEFSAWCRSVACEPILELPGEIDSPSTGAFYVAYAEQTLGVHPIAWEIGNEPALWSHFGVPWSGWTLAQRVTPTPSQYAQVVRAYVAAIRAVDATAPILGLPGVGTGEYQETAWINATVALNGPNLSGVAIHAYPAGAGPGTTP